MATIKSRTVNIVEAWAGVGAGGARPTNKKLSNLWTANRGLPYDNNAKNDLITRLKAEFVNFNLHLVACNPSEVYLSTCD